MLTVWKLYTCSNSSSPGDAYSRHCSRRLLKTLWPKEILLKLSNISFGNNVFNIIWQIYLSVFKSFRFLLICLKSRLLQICFRCWRVNVGLKMCMLFFHNPEIIFFTLFFTFFNSGFFLFLKPLAVIVSSYLVRATPLTVLSPAPTPKDILFFP